MPPQFQYFPVPSAPMHIIGMPPHRPPNANHQMSHSIPSQHGGQPPPPNQQQSAAKHQATLDKQLVNETIRRRISDKMLAQQASSSCSETGVYQYSDMLIRCHFTKWYHCWWISSGWTYAHVRLYTLVDILFLETEFLLSSVARVWI